MPTVTATHALTIHSRSVDAFTFYAFQERLGGIATLRTCTNSSRVTRRMLEIAIMGIPIIGCWILSEAV